MGWSVGLRYASMVSPGRYIRGPCSISGRSVRWEGCKVNIQLHVSTGLGGGKEFPCPRFSEGDTSEKDNINRRAIFIFIFSFSSSCHSLFAIELYIFLGLVANLNITCWLYIPVFKIKSCKFQRVQFLGFIELFAWRKMWNSLTPLQERQKKISDII